MTTDSDQPNCEPCRVLLSELPELPLPRQTTLAGTQRDRMVSLLTHRYVDHRDSIQELATRVGYSYAKVNLTLKESQVELRQRGGARPHRARPTQLGGGYTFTSRSSAGELLLRGFRTTAMTAPAKPESRAGTVSLSDVPLLPLIAALIEHHESNRPDERAQLFEVLDAAHQRVWSTRAAGTARGPVPGPALSTLRLFGVDDATVLLLRRLFPEQGLDQVSASLSQHLDGPCPSECLWDGMHPGTVEQLNAAFLAWQNVGWAELGLFDSA